MPDERRCDLCDFEKEAPCPGKDCHSGNNLQAFRPKGLKFGKDEDLFIEAFTYNGKGFVFTIGNKLSCRSEIVEVTPVDIMGILKK